MLSISNFSAHRSIAAFAATAALLSACHATPKAESTSLPRVLTYKVGKASESGAAYSGAIHTKVEQDLSFRIGGKILARNVNLGDRVKAGQVLMRLDPADYDDAVSGAEAAVASAQAQATRANANFDRLNALVASGSTSPDTLEQARAGKESAAANLQAAKAQLSTVKNQRGYTELRADADGVVVALSAEVGQVAAAGQPVIRLAQAGPPEAVVGLPSPDHTPGEAAKVTVFGAQISSYNAHLRQIAAAADPATRLFEARYVLDATLTDAPLGSTVTVTPEASMSETASSQTGLAVPLAALIDSGGGFQVWVIGSDEKVHARSVRVAHIDEETATIISGLSQGDVIVGAGAQLLHENEQVAQISGGKL